MCNKLGVYQGELFNIYLIDIQQHIEKSYGGLASVDVHSYLDVEEVETFIELYIDPHRADDNIVLSERQEELQLVLHFDEIEDYFNT